MKNYTLLSDPQEVIGKQWSEDQSPEQARILVLARDALCFIGATGQRYRFEDFRESLESGAAPPDGAAPALPSLEERLRETDVFFTKLRDETDTAGEKELIQVILDALHFITSTGQHRAFSEYLEHVEADAPPYVMASFATKEEAESWLRNHPHPPDSADVLVGNDSHDVVYERETNFRRLPRNRHLEHYLAELKEEEPPVAVESFATLEEAESWLKAQSEPARRAWVSIAGELYLAVYHPNIGHRALYPLSMTKGYELPSD